MRIEKRNNSAERKIVIGMVVDSLVLARLADKWDGMLFRSKWANIVGGWCVEHYRNYSRAPGRDITSIYEAWSQRANIGKETVELVERFLESISDEYERRKDEHNTQYVIDLAAKHINAVRAERLAEAIQGSMAIGRTDQALQAIEEFHRVDMGAEEPTDVLRDRAVMRETFAETSEPLIEYPGPLGSLLQDFLVRDAFVSLMGAEKRGKTFLLLDMAWRAMCQRRKVAFFEIGDMTRPQLMRRLYSRAARRPYKARTIRVPKAVRYVYGQPPLVTFEERKYDKPMTVKEARLGCERILKSRVKSKTPMFLLSVHPNDTISVRGIRDILRRWERDLEWVPDVIVIDYADNLASLPGPIDPRDSQINRTWKQLRAMSQEMHALVITATQADAKSYDAHTISRKNFSDDKRKLAHVTAMLGINSTPEERESDVRRLSLIVGRDTEWAEGTTVVAAGCSAICDPLAKSCWPTPREE